MKQWHWMMSHPHIYDVITSYSLNSCMQYCFFNTTEYRIRLFSFTHFLFLLSDIKENSTLMLLYGELNVLLLAHQVDAKRAYLFQEKEDLMLEGQYLQKKYFIRKKVLSKMVCTFSEEKSQ